MPPGIGGFNIAQPAQKTRPVEKDSVVRDMRAGQSPESLLAPSPSELDRQAPMQSGRRSPSMVSRLSAAGAISGVLLVVLPHPAGEQGIVAPGTFTRESPTDAARAAPPGRLAMENQKGFANEPLPLGISVNGGAGGETVTVTGLPDGLELSLGTSLGGAGWMLAASNLDRTFVGAPKDFIGAVQANVQLRSANGQLLDSHSIRLEWVQRQEPTLAAAPRPAEARPATATPDPEQITALIALGENFLKQGDIATARVLFKRAATAGNAQAALALGMTYDQAFLAQRGVLGVPPDAAQASQWYELAIKLGSVEAMSHLERSAGRPK
jgi:hypothetical protein